MKYFLSIYIFLLTFHVNPCKLISTGGIAQLGARLTGSQEARGSSPLISTI